MGAFDLKELELGASEAPDLAGSGWVGWLGIGPVRSLIWLVVVLAGFSVAGITLQLLVSTSTGAIRNNCAHCHRCPGSDRPSAGRLYRRATGEVSLVKTGVGGKLMIMDAGTFVVPLLHEVSPVNMKTWRL